MRKTTCAIILAAMTCVLAATVPAAASSSDESEFLRLLNERRASRSKRALVVRGDLVTIARRHSARMAESGNLYHNPRVAQEVRGEREVGENVGAGPDVQSLDQAFWESAGHRGNILYGGYNQVGIGVVRTEYETYVTFVFVNRPASSPARAAPDAEQKPAKKTSSSSSSSTSGSSNGTNDRQAASAAPSERRDDQRGASSPQREPERSVDLLVRTVALDAA